MFFDDWADNYDETISIRDDNYEEVFKTHTEVLNKTVKNISKYKVTTLLDICVATNNLTIVSANAGYNTIGIRLNSKMRDLCIVEMFLHLLFILYSF